MFPLDVLSQTTPAYRVAGRFGVDVFCLLWPTRGEPAGEGVRLCAHDDLSRLPDLAELFVRTAPARVERAALRDHALIAHPRGEFFSTDELALAQVQLSENRCSVDLAITHVENPNGIPAPRELYVVLTIEAGSRPPHSLELRFHGRQRDSQGNETPLDAPVAPPLAIELSA